MRRKVVAGNWKMNLTPSEGAKFAAELTGSVKPADTEVVLCVPFTDIAPVKAAAGPGIAVGAQNLHFEDKGAFTGEVTAAMLLECGAGYVIIGHSERRQYYAETDMTVNKKLARALAAGLVPIVCCGESLEQRQQNVTADWLRMQVRIAFIGVTPEDAAKTVIAYEPIWAIGTGVVATDEQAQEACAVIRNLMKELYGAGVSDRVRVLYGGSVSAKNASGLFAKPDIDGGLVGGASLKPEFADIIRAAEHGGK